MKNAARAFAAAALLSAGASQAVALEGNVNLFAGRKWLSESAWAPIETQPEFGVLLAFGQLRAPIHFAIDVLRSEESADVEQPGGGTARVVGGTWEYGIGVRKVFRRQAATRPHLGGGATLTAAEIEVEGPGSARSQADDSSFGFWIDGGITWRLASHLNLGIEVRYSRVRLDFGDIYLQEDVAGGGFHAGALIGFGW